MRNKVNIGKEIKRVMNEQGRKVSWLANKLGCQPQNIYKIYEKSTINYEQLFAISYYLDVDFFAFYSDALRNFSPKEDKKTPKKDKKHLQNG